MTYQKWVHRQGQLIVEQYTGICSFEDIMANEEALFSQLYTFNSPPLLLSDISRARFPELKTAQLEELFEPMDNNLDKTRGLREALYTGANQYADFKKTLKYADLSVNRPVSIVPFNSLDRAFRWLGINEEEQAVIKEQLSAAFVKKE